MKNKLEQRMEKIKEEWNRYNCPTDDCEECPLNILCSLIVAEKTVCKSLIIEINKEWRRLPSCDNEYCSKCTKKNYVM